MNKKMEYATKETQNTPPIRARNISELESVEHLKGTIQSSNNVSVMKKPGKPGQSEDKFYFFKKHSPESRLAELEAYGGSICRFLAGAEYVPSTRPRVDAQGLPVGSSSKLIKGFQTNLEDPLKPGDTRIESVYIKREHCKRIIEAFANQLVEIYDLEIGASQRSTSYAFLEDSYHAYFDTEATVYYAKNCIMDFLNGHNRYSDAPMNSLIEQLQKRATQLASENGKEQHLISQLTWAIQSLQKLQQSEDSLDITIEVFERLDHIVKQKNIEIYPLDSLSITENIDGCSYTISHLDLHNYRIVRGQAVSLTTSYIFKNGDDNNSNRSKKGEFLDFDWIKSNILVEFKDSNDFNNLFRNPTEASFACDEYNILHFPDVDDPTLFYWPTKQPEVHKRIFEYIGMFLSNFEENLMDELVHDKNNQLLRSIVKISKQVFVLLASTTSKPVSKTAYDSVADLFKQVVIRLNALKEGRSTEELMEEEQVKYFFTILHQKIAAIKVKVSELASQLDKTDMKELLDFMHNQFNSTVITKIEQLKSALGNLSVIMQETATLMAQHPLIMQAKHPLFNQEHLNAMFEELDSMLLNIPLEIMSLKTMMEKQFQDFQRNAYSLQDNQVYKSLALHPVFIFHKYKTFLKYILTNEQVYRTFAHLNIGSEPCTSKNGHEYNLHKKLVKDELLRQAEIYKTVISMADFREFLESHGNFAFELLKEEFLCAKTKYQNKIKERPIYNQLVQALYLDLIETQFNTLCSDCDLDFLYDKRSQASC